MALHSLNFETQNGKLNSNARSDRFKTVFAMNVGTYFSIFNSGWNVDDILIGFAALLCMFGVHDKCWLKIYTTMNQRRFTNLLDILVSIHNLYTHTSPCAGLQTNRILHRYAFTVWKISKFRIVSILLGVSSAPSVDLLLRCQYGYLKLSL